MPRRPSRRHQMLPAGCVLLSGKSCEACIELNCFDTQSTTLQESQQIAKRSLLLEQVNARHDRLLFHFPVEIISKIFGFYPEMSGYTTAVCAPQPQGVHASPFRITAVCKRWRNIGFSTPSLWASLLISFNCPTLNPAHRQSWWRRPEGVPSRSLAQGKARAQRGRWWFGLRSRTRRQGSSYGGHVMAMPSTLIHWLNRFDLLPPWLLRSGSQKLNISIQCSRFKYLKLPPEMRTTFKLIKNYASCWGTLNLTMPGPFCVEFFHGSRIEALHLTLLQLHELWAYTPRPKPYLMISTPSLDTIRMTNMDMSLARLDYSRITCICIEKISNHELLLLLKCAVRLERATLIKPALDIYVEPLDAHAHVHEFLTYLELQFQRYQLFPSLHSVCSLDAFIFPRLQQLSIGFNSAQNSMNHERLPIFLSHSQCPLVRLEFVNLNTKVLSDAALVQILEAVPSLSHLRLASARHPTSFLVKNCLRQLSGSGMVPRPSLLPNLESLVLEEWSCPSDDFLYLMDVFALSSRPIRTMKLMFITDDTSPPIVIPYKALVQLQRLKNKYENHTFQLSVIHRHERNGSAIKVDLIEASWKVYGATRT